MLQSSEKQTGSGGRRGKKEKEEKQQHKLTSDVLEHKWRASLKTILFLYE